MTIAGVILIAKKDPNVHMKLFREAQSGQREIEFFREAELIRNSIRDHIWQPKSVVILSPVRTAGSPAEASVCVQEEQKRVLAKWTLKKDGIIWKVYADSILVRYWGAKVGQVLQILRRSKVTGYETVYRLVVPQPPKVRAFLGLWPLGHSLCLVTQQQTVAPQKPIVLKPVPVPESESKVTAERERARTRCVCSPRPTKERKRHWPTFKMLSANTWRRSKSASSSIRRMRKRRTWHQRRRSRWKATKAKTQEEETRTWTWSEHRVPTVECNVNL